MSKPLTELQTAVNNHIVEMDEIMRERTSFQRGQKIATSISNLQIALEESRKAVTKASNPKNKEGN